MFSQSGLRVKTHIMYSFPAHAGISSEILGYRTSKFSLKKKIKWLSKIGSLINFKDAKSEKIFLPMRLFVFCIKHWQYIPGGAGSCLQIGNLSEKTSPPINNHSWNVICSNFYSKEGNAPGKCVLHCLIPKHITRNDVISSGWRTVCLSKTLLPFDETLFFKPNK